MFRGLRFLALLALIGLGLLATARQTAFLLGAWKADAIIGASEGPVGNGELSRIAAWTQARFEAYRDRPSSERQTLTQRFEPFLRRLPKPFRPPAGALETLLAEGLCDSAARTLGFLVASKGLSFRQFNMIAPSGGHTAVEIATESGPVFVDPYIGVIERGAVSGAKTRGATAVFEALKSGAAPEEALAPLAGPPELDFYADLDSRAAGGFQDAGATLDFTLPDNAAGETLGGRDGASKDVADAGAQLGISTFFSYLGHRFDRSWTRLLRSRRPVTLRIHTVGPLDAALLSAVEPAPDETGLDWALWRIGPERPLVLHDGRAPSRLLGAYQPIDMIELGRP